MKLKEKYPPNQESKTQDYYFTLTTKEAVSTYSDLTLRYPITFSSSNQYIVIIYGCNTSSIQAMPTKTRNAAEIRDTTMSMLSILPKSGHQLNLHIFVNEV